MRVILTFLMLAVLTANITAERKWWETMSLYQIYPRSFKDSDGDGVGDLRGIYGKLEHLRDIGVNAFWLSPVYPSPMVDMGYDISNFIDIEPSFGTMKDFEDLVEKSRSLGLKVLMDFVPNHSSDKHEWFVKSVKKIEPYTDYYIWVNGTVLENGTRVPPNNWLNQFGGTGWAWNDERNAYYFHQFTPQQPDLNFRNPRVVEEIENTLRFWLNKGVNGFRIDALPHLFEDELLRDEPPSGITSDPNNFDFNNHIHTMHLQENYEILRSWRDLMDEYKDDDRILLIEGYQKPKDMKKYHDYGAHYPFNFNLVFMLMGSPDAYRYDRIVNEWMSVLSEGANWVAGNHDQKRLVTRYGQRANLILTMVLLLPGISVTYNGEEIGMPDNYVSWEETTDPQGCNAGIENFERKSRDPARTPFLWDNTTSAGFSTNKHTWLPVNPNYKEINLEVQKNSEDSVYKFYKSLATLRTWPAGQEGKLTTYVFNENIFAFSRTMEGQRSIYVVLNVSNQPQLVDLTKFGNITNEVKIYRASPGSRLDYNKKIDLKNSEIPGFTSVIYVAAESS